MDPSNAYTQAATNGGEIRAFLDCASEGAYKPLTFAAMAVQICKHNPRQSEEFLAGIGQLPLKRLSGAKELIRSEARYDEHSGSARGDLPAEIEQFVKQACKKVVECYPGKDCGAIVFSLWIDSCRVFVYNCPGGLAPGVTGELDECLTTFAIGSRLREIERDVTATWDFHQGCLEDCLDSDFEEELRTACEAATQEACGIQHREIWSLIRASMAGIIESGKLDRLASPPELIAMVEDAFDRAFELMEGSDPIVGD